MRWIPLTITAYLLVLCQASLAKAITISGLAIGPVGPDLLAIAAVFVALSVADIIDAMIAGWILGLCMDLAAYGGPGLPTVIGPMSIAYALGSAGIFSIRGAFFRDRSGPQVLFALIFCVFSHLLWVTLQYLRSGGLAGGFGSMVLQVFAISAYTAVLMPFGFRLLGRVRSWLFAADSGRPIR